MKIDIEFAIITKVTFSLEESQSLLNHVKNFGQIRTFSGIDQTRANGCYLEILHF